MEELSKLSGRASPGQDRSPRRSPAVARHAQGDSEDVVEDVLDSIYQRNSMERRSSPRRSAKAAVLHEDKRSPYVRRKAGVRLQDQAHRQLLLALDDAVHEVCEYMEQQPDWQWAACDRDNGAVATVIRGSLCSSLACLFAYRYRSQPGSWWGSAVSMLSGQGSHFWYFIADHASNSSVSTLAGLSLQKALGQICASADNGRDENAKFRTFICEGLSTGKLLRWLHELADNRDSVCSFYDEGSFFHDRHARRELLAALKQVACSCGHCVAFSLFLSQGTLLCVVFGHAPFAHTLQPLQRYPWRLSMDYEHRLRLRNRRQRERGKQ